MGIKNLEDIQLWQLAMQLFELVVAITDRSPALRDCKYCDQIRDASRSVCSNLAEGYGRYSPAEFSRFITIALGSLKEVRSLLHEAHLRRFATDEEVTRGLDLARRIKSGCASMKTYLKFARPPQARRQARSENQEP